MIRRGFEFVKMTFMYLVGYACKGAVDIGFQTKNEWNVVNSWGKIRNILEPLTEGLLEACVQKLSAVLAQIAAWLKTTRYGKNDQQDNSSEASSSYVEASSEAASFPPFHQDDCINGDKMDMRTQGMHNPLPTKWISSRKSRFWELWEEDTVGRGLNFALSKEERKIQAMVEKQKKREMLEQYFLKKQSERARRARKYYAELGQPEHSIYSPHSVLPVPTVSRSVYKGFSTEENKKNLIQDPVKTGPACSAGQFLCRRQESNAQRKAKPPKCDVPNEPEIYASHALSTGCSFEENRLHFYQMGYKHRHGERKRKLEKTYTSGDPARNESDSTLFLKKRKLSHIDLGQKPVCFVGCLLCRKDEKGIRRRDLPYEVTVKGEPKMRASHAFEPGRSFEENRLVSCQTGRNCLHAGRKRKLERIHIFGDPAYNDISAVIYLKKRKLSHVHPVSRNPAGHKFS